MSAPEALVVLVLLDGWQMDCCGEEAALGDAVAWPLEVSDWNPPVAVGEDIDARVGAVEDPEWFAGNGPPDPATSERPGAALVRAGGLVAFLRDAPPVGTHLKVRPVFHEERHDGIPPATPDTRGVIRRVRAVKQAWRPIAGETRSYEPRPGGARLADAPALQRMAGADQWLVDLEVEASG